MGYLELGNCVTITRMKLFLFLLCATPLAVTVSLIPVARTLIGHVSLALQTSRNDPRTVAKWWDWYGSWIFFGGPFGRWLWGIALGFRILKSRHGRNYYLPGEMIEKPHLRLFILVLFTVIIAVFALGATTLEAQHPRVVHEREDLFQRHKTLICIPSPGAVPGESSRHVYEVLKAERIYNPGMKRNWQSLIEAPLFPQEDR
ncbi:hypothetical protein H0H93_008834 [Arthromyces matolae]|nr:hypothetical protein H0H93_008834 [Arthromyces matolae]